jgi:hypothetical protein
MTWGGIMVEAWKRKEATIAFSWGYNIYELDNIKKRKNPDFVGYPAYDYAKTRVLYTIIHGKDYIFKALNLLMSAILVGGNFAVYFVIKTDYADSPLV